MKRFFKKLALWGLLFCLLLAGLGYGFSHQIQRAVWDYGKRKQEASIARYGNGLPPIDEVRVLRMEEHSRGQGLGTYQIPFWHADGAKMTIEADKTLTGDAAQALAAQWRGIEFTTVLSACFEPHHVLQFRSNGRVIAEMIVCFECDRTTMPGFPYCIEVGLPSEKSPGRAGFLQFRETLEALVGKANDEAKAQ